MKFELNFGMDNAAFEDGPAEVARILRAAAERVEGGSKIGFCRDINGNKVGSFEFNGDDE